MLRILTTQKLDMGSFFFIIKTGDKNQPYKIIVKPTRDDIKQLINMNDIIKKGNINDLILPEYADKNLMLFDLLMKQYKESKDYNQTQQFQQFINYIHGF